MVVNIFYKTQLPYDHELYNFDTYRFIIIINKDEQQAGMRIAQVHTRVPTLGFKHNQTLLKQAQIG